MISVVRFIKAMEGNMTRKDRIQFILIKLLLVAAACAVLAFFVFGLLIFPTGTRTEVAAHPLNYERMAQVCALEERRDFCLVVVEGMRATHTQLTWVTEERPEIGAEDRARFVTHFRIKLNEERMWTKDMFPKMWTAHVQR